LNASQRGNRLQLGSLSTTGCCMMAQDDVQYSALLSASSTWQEP
jgi:hypothetical protein